MQANRWVYRGPPESGERNVITVLVFSPGTRSIAALMPAFRPCWPQWPIRKKIRLLDRAVSACAIDLPSPRFWRRCSVLYDNGKVGMIDHAREPITQSPRNHAIR